MDFKNTKNFKNDKFTEGGITKYNSF